MNARLPGLFIMPVSYPGAPGWQAIIGGIILTENNKQNRALPPLTHLSRGRVQSEPATPLSTCLIGHTHCIVLPRLRRARGRVFLSSFFFLPCRPSERVAGVSKGGGRQCLCNNKFWLGREGRDAYPLYKTLSRMPLTRSLSHTSSHMRMPPRCTRKRKMVGRTRADLNQKGGGPNFSSAFFLRPASSHRLAAMPLRCLRCLGRRLVAGGSETGSIGSWRRPWRHDATISSFSSAHSSAGFYRLGGSRPNCRTLQSGYKPPNELKMPRKKEVNK
ncbi:hypothetical protein GGS23DRAFT_58798 [Durotheca rogersii]|uniref:uncharacterized protein n=1 Tax=Durotheca rogersii TaxID=419775 RepID=UPI00221FE41D|nr:uncharacterized protein GGS23DRAFT_58798 [Durotheca rogersii]KAI5863213.1 hypothetical protein GGS23DRAFT_58798 [Durotheca rogersii]